MFDIVWENRSIYRQKIGVGQQPTNLPISSVKVAALSMWEEHCIECAVPTCYETCAHFQAREDKKCLRLTYGFAKNESFRGLYPYGFDCQFKKWGKIECQFNLKRYSVKRLRQLDRLNGFLSKILLKFSRSFSFISPNYRPVEILTALRRLLVEKQLANIHTAIDTFVLECYSCEDKPFNLHMQCDKDGLIINHHAFLIKPGMNFFQIPLGELRLSRQHVGARIFLYPENDLNCRLIFTWLDFVELQNAKVNTTNPADKIKCVAWDLDDTLWQGTLIEDGIDNIVPNKAAINLIKEFDKRGILNTVVSKNDYEGAWAAIEKLNLGQFFLYPAINWGAKSENILQIAKNLNIGVDSFAFVDNSVHERAEVKSRIPVVRIYEETEIEQLGSYPEFDLPVTEMSAKRRKSYIAQVKREEILESFGDDYHDFLKSLELHMEVFKPQDKPAKDRCFELIQRSNQLNLSTYRYDREEFENLFVNRNMMCVAFRCWDKFGDYGIVGFTSINIDEKPRMVDLVISCRIAQKRYEYALFFWLVNKLKAFNFSSLDVNLMVTKKNGPLIKLFSEMPFETIEESNDVIRYRLVGLDRVIDEGIINMKDEW